jgi:hypothetical protein
MFYQGTILSERIIVKALSELSRRPISEPDSSVIGE